MPGTLPAAVSQGAIAAVCLGTLESSVPQCLPHRCGGTLSSDTCPPIGAGYKSCVSFHFISNTIICIGFIVDGN